MTAALVRRPCLMVYGNGSDLTQASVQLLNNFGIDLQPAERRMRIFCRPASIGPSGARAWRAQSARLSRIVVSSFARPERVPDSRAVATTRAARRRAR